MPVSSGLRYSVSSVQGRRPYNEDRFCVHSPLTDRSGPSESSECSLFAVLDGHGGEECAERVSVALPQLIVEAPLFEREGERQRAIETSFRWMDERLLKEGGREAESGSTASIVLIDRAFIYSGNCGDTRNVLCREGRPIVLSVDHKPTDEGERTRIEAAGAKVTIQPPPPPPLSLPAKALFNQSQKPLPVNAYVELGDCGLAVSRAFGDCNFKRNKEKTPQQQAIICTPYVTATERSDRDEFLILASDGLWNFVDEKKVIDFVRQRLLSDKGSERDIEDIAHKLTQFALDKKSNDNVTVVLVVFPLITTLQQAVGKNETKVN